MTNHPFENPKPEHVWKHCFAGGASTLAGPRKYQEMAPKSRLGHLKAWVSINPTRKATQKCGSP